MHFLLTNDFPLATVGLPAIFDFLMSLVDSGLSHSSVQVYLAAIYAFHDLMDSHSLFPHLLSKCFLKDLLYIHPLTKELSQPWDLLLVLCCLTRRPFNWWPPVTSNCFPSCHHVSKGIGSLICTCSIFGFSATFHTVIHKYSFPS